MNGNISPDGDLHQKTQLLLSWYAAGTLDEDEAAVVKTHLAECADCREELAFERSVREDLRLPPPDLDVDAGWAALRAQLPVSAAPVSTAPASSAEVVPFRPRSVFRRPIPLGWALAAQAAAILLMVGGSQIRTTEPSPEAHYRALGSPPSSLPGNILVMFRPDTREADMRRILIAAEAELAGRPNANGAYSLRVESAQRAAILADLQHDPHVTMAQPIDGEAP